MADTPKPAIQQRAEQYAKRWARAGLTALAVYLALLALGFDQVGPIALLVAGITFGQAHRWDGFADGYQAATDQHTATDGARHG